MKIALTCCVVGFLALAGVTVASAGGAMGDTEAAITALEKQWTQGESSNKVDLIAPLLANKFIITESSGNVFDRAGFLAVERESHYRSSDIDEIKILVFGDTAIANYSLRQKYTLKGKAFDTYTRETDTWVKGSDGSWQCVAAHGSKIKKT